MNNHKAKMLNLKHGFLFMVVLVSHAIICQNKRQEKMQNLSFMIGEWEGTSITYKNDTIATKVSALQNISYQLDEHIITIDLQSKTLQLHTVIYYDDKMNSYYYNSFYKQGAGKYKATFKDGKFIVSASDTKRFVFTTNSEGNFTEYGEILVDGKWQLYFKDIFEKVKP